METFIQDLRYAIRVLAKRPAFAATAILALALGIGANTAIFSVVNGVLLRPLPFSEAEQLVRVSIIQREDTTGAMAPADFIDYRDQNQVFDGMAAFIGWGVTMTGQGEPERLTGSLVSAPFFSVLKAQAQTGRTFLPGEDQPGAARAVVISDGLWRRRFGADPAIVGKALSLNGESFTVVGVMPRDFDYPRKTEVWGLPRRVVPELPFATGGDILELRGLQYLRVIARLKKGVTVEEAQSEMEALSARLREQHPDTNAERGIKIESLQESMVGEIRPALLILLGAVGFVLAVACANVANLLLSRAAARQKEFALRTALGASRPRIIRQLLTESLLLALLGGGLGLMLAIWGTGLLVSVSPGSIPRAEEIGVDSSVLGFTLLVSLVTGIVFGLAPVISVSRADLNEALKEGGRTSAGGPGRRRARSLLVAAEVAMSFVLLIGAGLLIKSFLRLQQVDPGFNPENLLTLRLSLSGSSYDTGSKQARFYEQLLERIESLPGVETAGGIERLPIENRGAFYSFSIMGRPAPASTLDLSAGFHSISPNYFSAMRTPLLKGRDFTARDTEDAPGVVIVNEHFARLFFPDEDPIGKRISFGTTPTGDPNWIEIVGVVENIRHVELERDAQPETYVPFPQTAYRFMTIVVRSPLDSAALASAVRGEVSSLDAGQPIYEVKPMEQVLASSTAQRRLATLLLGVFAGVALLLAAVGLYGVMSYSVTQRRHEIGIRLALGARATDVLRMVVGQGMIMASVGIAAGFFVSLALSTLMESLLFGVTATDRATFVTIPLLLLAVAFLASYLPARRATKVDPMIALRYE